MVDLTVGTLIVCLFVLFVAMKLFSLLVNCWCLISVRTSDDVLRSSVDTILGAMNIQSDVLMSVAVPKLKSIQSDDIDDCYDSSFGTKDLNFFNSTFRDVVYGFMVCLGAR